MVTIRKNRLLLISATLTSFLVGTSIFGLSLTTQAQDQVSQDQDTALKVVAKMTEGQRTYYEKHGKFQDVVNDVEKEFGVKLPSTFDYAIRTTSEAAYVYVIPAKSSKASDLKAYVGGAFITPNQNPKITTIICENNQPGQTRPADPQLVRGTNPTQEKNLVLECQEFSSQVPASKLTE